MKNREDWLVEQLDRDDLSVTLRAKYEAELEEIARRIEVSKARSKTREKELAAEREKARFEELETREKELAKAMDMDYDTWLNHAKSLYRVDGCLVTSIARGPDHERQWDHDSHFEAREHVFKLISWKFYDHFQRGSNFTYLPTSSKDTT